MVVEPLKGKVSWELLRSLQASGLKGIMESPSLSVLARVSIAVVKHHDQEKLEEERVLSGWVFFFFFLLVG